MTINLDDPVARAFRHVLINIDVESPDAVCWAIHSAGLSFGGNGAAIERALTDVRRVRGLVYLEQMS